MNKTVYLIGSGPGQDNLLTGEALSALHESQCVIGAERLLTSFIHLTKGKECCAFVAASDIIDCITTSKSAIFSVLLSGDIGFYSGAKKLIKPLRDRNCDTKICCGISSVVYFASRLGVAWDDAALLSFHGSVPNNADPLSMLREKNRILGWTGHNKKVFCLTDNRITPAVICTVLTTALLGDVRVSVGENLSYASEHITSGTASELSAQDFMPLSVMCIQNDNPVPLFRAAFLDTDFIRGNVPMTKEEVRTVSISKLCIKPDAIVWDIGAGTGSVSCCAAIQAVYGRVYAVERNHEALELIRQNKQKHKIYNIELVAGDAPAALCDLPVPDSVFIGGSGGCMEDILTMVFTKNPHAYVVINAIALETVSEILRILEKLPATNTEILQLGVSRTQKTGSYHLMKAENPIFIVILAGK